MRKQALYLALITLVITGLVILVRLFIEQETAYFDYVKNVNIEADTIDAQQLYCESIYDILPLDEVERELRANGIECNY